MPQFPAMSPTICCWILSSARFWSSSRRTGTSAVLHAFLLNTERLSVSCRNVNVVREMALQSPLLSFRGNRTASLAGDVHVFIEASSKLYCNPFQTSCHLATWKAPTHFRFCTCSKHHVPPKEATRPCGLLSIVKGERFSSYGNSESKHK